ncbi:adenosylcobinamide-GDP ribazoletransferase [Ruminococcus sp. OA3]|uniref:adenosylcobinamide-GDP ribazoletransferase n=1 Tax=Ruminococcus sp. OA3 TaxID=2914164 RepID=UPI001F05D8FD|nr:adenosylcobinamide-GDP ribazoletransferase [Ruminococcus sp. OA3]MCH1983636.1 adenosylcobinamide-GDP ribazoletransferase [Ruminococcus sp. OA3]
MKRLINSFIIAFSMYSKIPMPRCDWSEKNMAYAMCFWPWVGAVIGGLCWLWGVIGLHASMNPVFFTVILLLISVFVTGGIHLDGLLDTADAMSSYQERERRLEILKDSHAGAFAVITCVVYFALMFGIYSQMNMEALKVIAPGFMLSRSMSALAIVTFPKARKDGSVATLSRGARTRRVRFTMAVYILVLAGVLLWIDLILGTAALAGAVLVYGYYHHMAMKHFGGTTGDLAGWFLSVCELVMPLAVVAVQIVMGARL